MLKVAVVGLGGIGNTHARFYNENEEVELVGVCDIQQDRADKAAQTHGVKAYYSIDELLQSAEFDAVSVCSAGVENGGDHYTPTMQVLEAGKHTLTEKPISNNIEHAREMVAKAKEKGVKFGINLNHRCTPAAERLKKFQTDGELGDVLFVNMALWINNPNESSPWFHIRALHPHSIDVMRYFGGDIARVQCFMHKGPGREIWSNLSMNVQFESGAVGHLTGSYDASMQHPIERCEVGGSKGRGIIDNVYERLEFLPRESREKTVIENGIFGGMGSFQDTFKNRINKFVSQVIADEELEGSGAEGLAAQEVIEAAIRSHENGTVEEVVKN